MGYYSLENNAVVLGSILIFVILIYWHYICAFPVNLSPNFVNKEKIVSVCNHWS